jgi:hypothetical protein
MFIEDHRSLENETPAGVVSFIGHTFLYTFDLSKVRIFVVRVFNKSYSPSSFILIILQIKLIVACPEYSVVRNFPVPSECRNYNCQYSTADGLCAYHLSPPKSGARFSQPFRLKRHLFVQRNVNQNILSLLAEGHIQFSQGQRPWKKANTKIRSICKCC